jgi:hypothetical protein
MAINFAAIQAIGTGLSVVSTIAAGRAARQEAAFNRKQLEFQSKMQKNEAAATANQRLRDFDAAQSQNNAFFAILNRDPSDRSLKAFMERQKEIAYADADAIESQGLIQASQTARLAQMQGIRGRNAIVSSYLNAGSAITTGLYRYHIYKTDKLGEEV